MSKVEQRWTEFEYGGLLWRAPRGFGAEYRRRLEREMPSASTIRSALQLIGYTAKLSSIEKWPPLCKIEAMAYAANVHARASDCPLPRHPLPDWFPLNPWTGPEVGRGAFAGPGPTEIPDER